ncbi:plasminogen-like isoform X2 [Pithys albifrons albifrons]|uniref:plasminogen-like isoform X2 n=1 Tax=Pithys albifrons albifrons TaxID=3385563 RepID=UPI003A5CAB3B
MGISKAAFLFLFLFSSVKGDILDDYQRTDGVWIVTRNKRSYQTDNEKECAEKCEAERSFNCRAFLFTRKKLQCLTLAENAKMTVMFASVDAVLYEKRIYLLECKRGIGKDYRGTEARTWKGILCQKWAEKIPHKTNYTPEKYPNAGLEENYCRNPDGDERGPWCYTTDPAIRYDYCNIPDCEDQVMQTGEGPTVECMQCNGEDYHGEVSRTESGLECQGWDAQEPHMHGFTTKHYPEKDLRMNYCRNPDDELRPWCFTTSPTKRWEYCKIPRCNTGPAVSGPGSQCLSGKGEDYRGRIAITESGNACQRWNTQFPHKHGWIPDKYPCKGLEENYCRNPDGEKRPWCYTINDTIRWEYCTIPPCDGREQEITDVPIQIPLTEECYQGKGQSYRGTTSITASGKKCQAWNSMFPHRHEKTPDRFPDADLRENYCRNPDNDNSPWCFTTDPSTLWEYCNLKRCDDHTQEPTPNDPPARMAQDVGLTTPTTSASSEHDCGKVPMRNERACEKYSMCKASPGAWPWHISLRTSTNKHHCAGTLIHPQWVLTAAQCLEGSTEPSAYRVFLGTQNLNAEEPSLQIQSVQKVLKEPSGADIALLKLNSPVTITDHVKPVCLPPTSLMVERNAECFLTTWGKIRGTNADNRLKDVEFPILENEICNRPEFMNGTVKNHEFCGGFTFGNIDNCEAEVGGPLVCQDKDRFVQYGVTSWGLDCTQPSKLVFVRIPSFVPWIKNAMTSH